MMLNLDVVRIKLELETYGYRITETPEGRWMCSGCDDDGFTLVRSSPMEALEDAYRALTMKTPPCHGKIA